MSNTTIDIRTIPAYANTLTDHTWIEMRKLTIKATRDHLIEREMWRYERNARELRLGITPTDSAETMHKLDLYIKELTDIPSQNGFPFIVFTWPKRV